jgi:hypothetical protein
MLALLRRCLRALRRMSAAQQPVPSQPREPTAEERGPVSVLPPGPARRTGRQRIDPLVLDDADEANRRRQSQTRHDMERAFHRDAEWRRGEGGWK